MGLINHELKCLPEFFEAIRIGNKTFELCEKKYFLSDCYPADTLTIREWIPESAREWADWLGWREAGAYSGRTLQAKVTYVMNGPTDGLDEDHVIVSYRVVDET